MSDDLILSGHAWREIRKEFNRSFGLNMTFKQIKSQKAFIRSRFLNYRFLRGYPGFT